MSDSTKESEDSDGSTGVSAPAKAAAEPSSDSSPTVPVTALVPARTPAKAAAKSDPAKTAAVKSPAKTAPAKTAAVKAPADTASAEKAPVKKATAKEPETKPVAKPAKPAASQVKPAPSPARPASPETKPVAKVASDGTKPVATAGGAKPAADGAEPAADGAEPAADGAEPTAAVDALREAASQFMAAVAKPKPAPADEQTAPETPIKPVLEATTAKAEPATEPVPAKTVPAKTVPAKTVPAKAEPVAEKSEPPTKPVPAKTEPAKKAEPATKPVAAAAPVVAPAAPPEAPTRPQDAPAAPQPTATGSSETASAETTSADTTSAGAAPAGTEAVVDGDAGDGDGPEDDASAKDDSPAEGGALAALGGLVREVVLVLVIALGLSLLIKTFLVQAFFIPSPSMESTLIRGDRVLVSKLTPGPFDLKRGDIVVFADPDNWLSPIERAPEGPVRGGIRSALIFVGLLPADSDEHLIKRLIGLPGDKVICCDDNDRLTVNGVAVDEPYIYGEDLPSEMKFSVTVPAGHIWVMGDHRSVSQDSRFHQESQDGGSVPLEDVVGRAMVKVWPLNRGGLLRNPKSTFAEVPAP